MRDILGLDWNEVLTNLIFAAVLMAVGILLGILINWILKKIAKKARLDDGRSYNFVRLFITVITWSIYILFLNLALVQLDIPTFTNWLSSILLVIPALTGALVLIAVGFAIATYLKTIIEDSRIEDYKVLSRLLWFFIIYIFSTYALKTALISIDSTTTNWLLIVLTGIVGAGVAFYAVKKGR